MFSHQLCFGTCFYFLSTAVGEIIAVDKRFLDLSTNVMMHVEAIIVTTLITTARVYKRQTQQVLPAECYLLCDEALLIAENDGRATLCRSDSRFRVAYADCEECLSININTTGSKTENGAVITSLNALLSYCNVTSAPTSFNSHVNSEFSAAITEASLCLFDNITSDCPATHSGNVTVASSTAANYSGASTLPLKSAGAIAGVAVACTIAVVLIIALVIFLGFRRRKRHKQDKIRKAETANRQEDKAQLHSEDLKPIRKELSGDQPLTSRKDVPIAEMPANEDPRRMAGEMPANEVVGTELQGESNEERNEENGSSQSN